MKPSMKRSSFAILVLLLTALASASGQAAQVTFHHAAPGAGSVNLAGTFNNWSDSTNPMTGPDADGNWQITVELAAGTYQYKFVVDGQWRHDETNPAVTDDGYGGKNSVLEIGDADADVVVGLADGAAPGTPIAPAQAASEPATTIPAVEVAPGEVMVLFTYAATGSPGAVYLAGEFNGWNAQGQLMTDDDSDGVYEARLSLKPGEYQYKFVVDGQWQQDPANPDGTDDGFGGQNSVVRVVAGAGEMRASGGPGADTTGAGTGAAATPGATGMRSVEFRYTPVISGVQNVFLAGTFNDWNDSKTRMSDADSDGTYTVTILLQPGTYQYKFVVDGNWHQDPNNPEGAEDGFGGQNSVLNVDTSFATIDIEQGDGKIYADDIEPIFDYSTCNPLTATEIVVTARAHLDDVEDVALLYRIDGGELFEKTMSPVEQDPAFQYYRATVQLLDASNVFDYVIRYRDGDGELLLGATGPAAALLETDDQFFRYTAQSHPPFLTPEWAKDGVIYQIFPERFRNGDASNDPDFSEPWYVGATKLPASGKTNGEYFHLMEDWYDIDGLKQSPYRTDGRPDYYSFYGGDIAGIREKLDYLNDLGVTVIYFNPLNQGMSNHKYDPVDYLTIDPHFAGEQEFTDFVADAHDHGIRIVVDMAFNHTGNWHFAFRDAVDNGPSSEYYNWYEFHRWPLPKSRDFKAADYYDCWWGFGLHPNLNFDLQRANADENNLEDTAAAAVNQPVVDYVLSVADKWLGEYDIDGFRLDVPNEVPFWFWKLFSDRCHSIKPDCYLVGELWGNAGRWIGPTCFDATMNYKFFRDPVMDFFGKGVIDAAGFDMRLAPGRFQYPPQSVAVMMNLIDSHDTIRFLTSAGDVRRLMLAALFGMTYVGMPTIWYGDEVGMVGGKDPDCRRPFDWRYEGDPRKQALRDYYGTITRFRRDRPVLSRGDFNTLVIDGRIYGFARTLEDQVVVVLFNAGPDATTVTLDATEVLGLLPDGADATLAVIVGPEVFPQASGGSVATGEEVALADRVTITVPGMSGVLLAN